MMSGFVLVDSDTFYVDIWPQIKDKVEAVESNWDEAKKGARPVVIKWGYKDENSGEKIIVAINQVGNGKDEHWVAKELAPKNK